MKIDATRQIVFNATKSVSAAGRDGRNQRLSPLADTVSLSPGAQLLQTAEATRSEAVEALRELVGRGAYRPDPTCLASALLEKGFHD